MPEGPFGGPRPFAENDEIRTELIEFELHPVGTSFSTSPLEVENLMSSFDLRVDVVEDVDGTFVVKVREDMNINQLQKFVNAIQNQMDIQSIRSILVAPRR